MPAHSLARAMKRDASFLLKYSLDSSYSLRNRLFFQDFKVPQFARTLNVRSATELFTKRLAIFVFKKINFSSCAFPDYSKDLTVNADTQCTSYLTGLATGFTYNSCFLRHSDEPNFTTNEWQVFMNTNLLTQRFDTIELLDQNGLVIDQKQYSL